MANDNNFLLLFIITATKHKVSPWEGELTQALTTTRVQELFFRETHLYNFDKDGQFLAQSKAGQRGRFVFVGSISGHICHTKAAAERGRGEEEEEGRRWKR